VLAKTLTSTQGEDAMNALTVLKSVGSNATLERAADFAKRSKAGGPRGRLLE